MSTPGVQETTETVRAELLDASDYRPVLDTPEGRLLMATPLCIVVQFAGEPHVRQLRLTVELVDRRYVIRSIELEPGVVAGELFPRLRVRDVGRWLHRAASHESRFESADGVTYTSTDPMPEPIDPVWPVVLAYSTAHLVGRPPTQAVADRLGISHAAAANRVKRARAAGYLPTTEPGKAS